MLCLHVLMCTTRISGTRGSQKRASDKLELELQMVTERFGYMYTTCVPDLGRPAIPGFELPGNGVTGSTESPFGFWESSLVFLKTSQCS